MEKYSDFNNFQVLKLSKASQVSHWSSPYCYGTNKNHLHLNSSASYLPFTFFQNFCFNSDPFLLSSTCLLFSLILPFFVSSFITHPLLVFTFLDIFVLCSLPLCNKVNQPCIVGMSVCMLCPLHFLMFGIIIILLSDNKVAH